MRLFSRAWKVTAYQGAPLQYFTRLRKAIDLTSLRIQFSVEMHLDSEPNTARVTVTNAARATRAFLTARPLIVQIDAGYDGVARHLFTGDLRFGESTHEGTEWSTTIELGDGDRAFRHARVSRSYRAGTSVVVALREAAASMGLDLPVPIITSPALATQFAAGVVLHGPARDELTKLLAPYGYSWSVQAGKLVILRDGDTAADKALVISEETGMIGSPELGAPESGGPPHVTVRSLLYPEVVPGGKVSIQGQAVRGIYKVLRVTHAGDTHGGDWTTEIEARPA